MAEKPRKRFIVRVNKKEFVLRYADSEEQAVWSTAWNLDMETKSKALLQCYEYQPDEIWEGEESPLFSDDHTHRPFQPNWVVRYGQKAEEVR